MTTVLERAAELIEEVEKLRRDPTVSNDAKLVSLTIESSLLRIEDRLLDIAGTINSG